MSHTEDDIRRAHLGKYSQEEQDMAMKVHDELIDMGIDPIPSPTSNFPPLRINGQMLDKATVTQYAKLAQGVLQLQSNEN
jgi:hypothetical protein